MWIITGPFDTEIGADLSFQKSKLLKTGRPYSLGRKGQPLLIGSKKVSANHCEFIVGNYTQDDVHDPGRKPTLEFVNKRDKGMRLLRGDTQLVVSPGSSKELEDGDAISIVTGLPIKVNWHPICCYSPNLRGKSSISLETCTELGISVVYASSPQVTHHILSTYIANPSVAASLISAAQFVKLDWLSDILRNADTLEETCVLPLISKYRPTFSPTLSPSQKVFKVWEPNEERLNMLAEYRFLVFGEKVREVESDLKDLIQRGGGFLDTFDVAGGVVKLHKALTRCQAKEGQLLVVVADAKDMTAAIGENEWKKLVAEVQSFGLHITQPQTVVQSVLDVEPSLLTARQPSPVSSTAQETNISTAELPSYVPNSIPNEPSLPPEEPIPPRKRLLRRAASRQPSVEPTSETATEAGVKTESPTKPRRPLLSRRGKTAEPNENAEPSEASAVAPVVPPTPGRPRLKRRLGATQVEPETQTGVAQSQLPDLSIAATDEPPLKKFRALFEASEPGRTGTVSFDEDAVMGSGTLGTTSQTQSQTQGFVRRPAAGSSLSALREEEEEESHISGADVQRGVKRTLGVVQEEDQDIEMVDANPGGTETGPAQKRQAFENVNSVERMAAAATGHSPKKYNKEGERKPGAPVGKPDTDAEFLKAIAKKGKKTGGDTFDREFNNLRISKPKLGDAEERQEVEEEWRKFADFGDDSGLRGNFMVVMEMDVFVKDKGKNHSQGRTEQNGRAREIPEQWRDKANFKKFKKKTQAARGALVELVLSENYDYDAAPTHWRSKKSSQSQRTTSSLQMEIKSERQSVPPRPMTTATIIISDSENENEPPKLGKRKAAPTTQAAKVKAAPRAGSRAPSTQVGSKPPSRAGSVPKRTASRSSKQALFLDSDEDVQEVDEAQAEVDMKGDEEVEDEEDQTLRSSGATKGPMSSLEKQTRPMLKRRTRATAMKGDDSDDDAVFKGFGTGKRKR